MVSLTSKVVLVSAGVAAVALFLKVSAPMAVDFSLWSSFLSWMKPPYLFLVINVIITILVASSSYNDGEDGEIRHGGDDCYKIETESVIDQEAPPMRKLVVGDVVPDGDSDFVAAFPPPATVVEVERSVEEEPGVINGGDECLVLKSKLDQVPLTMEELENVSPAEKPPVSAIIASLKGGKKKKTLRVAKPKRQETSLENTWKTITDEGENSTTLAVHYQRSDTFGLGAEKVKPAALRKSETFRDVTNYQKSSPVKVKKEVSPSREELNRRVEAFIRKCKEQRLYSLRLDKDMS